MLTRLGEAQILLPAMGIALLWLVAHAPSRPLAWRWASGTLLAAALTALTKVAFIGFGVGMAGIDFTGLSGHAMFSAAILPWLLNLLLRGRRQSVPGIDLLPGAVLALLIAISRVHVGAHSWSEALLGYALGGAVTLWLWSVPETMQRIQSFPLTASWLLGTWLLLVPLHAPPSHSHSLVIALSLRVSGHDRPYTRERMLREHRPRHHADVAQA
ncbi:MAG: phosphatase PAP2 family protein [Leptothrix sp. (in: b-proteobacteria)]